jgi:hypothetical protein
MARVLMEILWRKKENEMSDMQHLERNLLNRLIYDSRTRTKE